MRIERDSEEDEFQMKKGTVPYLIVHYICVRVTKKGLEYIAIKGENFRGVGSPLKDFITMGVSLSAMNNAAQANSSNTPAE